MLIMAKKYGGEGGIRTLGTGASPYKRFSNTQVGSEPLRKFFTLLLSSTGYKSVDLIRSACK